MNIEWIKNKSNEKFYPISHENAILCGKDSDITLADKLNGIESGTTTVGNALSLGGETAKIWQAKINVESARIDQLIAMEEGSIVTDVEKEVADIKVGADGVTYGTAGTAVRTQIENIKSELSYSFESMSKVTNIDGVLLLNPNDFEIGNITITPDGWAYDTSYTTRVCTKQGVTLHLEAGDIIGLKDYSNARYYLGWLNSDGVYKVQSWKSEETRLWESGDYVILLCNLTDTNLNGDKYTLLDLLFIKRGSVKPTKNEHLATIINSAYGYVTINTTSKTITIPPDVLVLKRSSANGASQYIQVGNQTIDYSSVGSSAVVVYLDIETGVFRPTHYEIGATENEVVFCTIRHSDGYDVKVSMNCPYYIDKKPFGMIDVDKLNNLDKSAINPNVKSINHRGWNEAPENTLPAYKLSKLQGFDYVETDISFTSDNVGVLLHDNTINRTARNADGTEISDTVRIRDLTYEQALTYDFGIWKSSAYAGTKIPTFEEFVILCRNIGLNAYVEIKYADGASQSNIEGLVDIATRYGMLDHITWISFSSELLGHVHNYNSNAKIGLVCNTITASEISAATELGAFLDSGSSTAEEVALCVNANIPLEVWTINNTTALFALDPYVSGVTSDNLVAGYELYKNYTQ